MSKLQKIAAVFLVIAVVTGILHKTGVFYVPGLTALTLCVAMCAEGSDLLKGTGKKKNTSRRLAAILVLAFGLLSLGYTQLVGYITTHALGFTWLNNVFFTILPYETLRGPMLLVFLGVGVVLGGIGTAGSVRKYLKV